MLNLFPIQFLALFAYFILRLVTGSILLYWGVNHYRERVELATKLTWPWWPFGRLATASLIVGELVMAHLLIFGFYTQIAALLLCLYAIKLIWLQAKLNLKNLPSRSTSCLLLGIGLSLFITGAGVFAFDLPI